MMTQTELLVDFCDHKAAKFAVEHWHYSKTMPASKTVKMGAWEQGQFIGCVIFSLGNSKDAGKRYGLSNTEICELTRIALKKHKTEVSKIISLAIKMLKRQSPKIKLIVSLADRHEGHLGVVYQASNWIYTGYQPNDKRLRRYRKNGRVFHWRTVSPILLQNGVGATVEGAKRLGYIPSEYLPKHKYLYPLDRAIRRQISPLAKPYPKRADA